MAVYVGVDFHVKSQTVCWIDTSDGEIHERTLDHKHEEVAAFYNQWTTPVTVEIEALGYTGWFHRLVEQRGHHLLVGDAYAIRQFARRRQKNDRRDAELMLDLLRRGDFPVVHRPGAASREVLDLLHHRERLVGMRTVRLYRLLREEIDYEEFRRRGRDARRARPVDEAVQA